MGRSWGGPSTRGGSAIPELPEVETVRRELEPWLTGRTILRVELVEAVPGPKYARLERATGQRIVRVGRRGKFIIMPLSRAGAAPAEELVVHLGMTGVISHCPPADHLRVRLELDQGPMPTLYFRDVRRFGRFLVVPAGDYRLLPTLDAMGPEPLSDEFTARGFHQALLRSSVPVKTYLLSQKPVAGVGNIYADEALWLARVHPETPAQLVSRAKAQELHEAIRTVLEASVAAQGTTLNDYRTVNGEVGAFLEQLAVYGHAEEPCRRCGTPISRTVIGGRSTHFCSRCQRRRRRK
ncbi:MAG TPA: bifunctional DNA-formamidopyrimidine glycosylase/DNA-(apurinic or apyrimidinic site) lyase [Trueperaceae bacterium]